MNRARRLGDRRPMTARNHKTIPALLTALLVALLCATTASASKSQLSVLEDPQRTINPQPSQQTASLDETVALGGDVAKLTVSWRAIAPEGASAVKPPGVDLSDPGSYPAGSWETIDRAVAGAEARGLRVWLMISGPAPRWAVARETTPGLGAWLPDPTAYAEFVKAVARRYPGVHMYSFWNEANLKRFIQPQSSGGSVTSAVHYRSMYRSAHKALEEVGHGSDTILFGELLARYQAYVPQLATRPLIWLRAFFCIDRAGRPLRGSAARLQQCANYRPIRTSGLAYHPYNLSGTPLSTERNSPDNAPINYLPRVERLLDQAAKAHRLTTRRLKIYSSEYGIQSNPPDKDVGQPIGRIPFQLNVSEYLSWADPRVATYSQYLIVDDVEVPGVVSFQTGLRFFDGRPKPGVYAAYQTPMLVMTTRSANRVSVWGCLRAKPPGTTGVDAQVRSAAGWSTVRTLPVSTANGCFMQDVALSGARSKTWRLSWSGGVSRSAKPIAPVRAHTD
jgi:hypothetical protein